MNAIETPRSPAVAAVTITFALVVPTNLSNAASSAPVAVGGDVLQALEVALADRMLQLAEVTVPSRQDEAVHGEQSPQAPPRSIPTRPDFGARARRVHSALTGREREVLCLLAGGATNDAIASHLFISPKTASVHVSRILSKLDATTRTEAAALAHASGLVRSPDMIGQHAVNG